MAFTTVPEPSRMVLLLLGMLSVMRRRSRGIR
ncbi:MAG: PEP-CTERM sorting domain-containing protein [Verrucomicrobiaceae bacterium]|nr:PEP-CTERM sorting domain-containing protein [Verrucomicrobiaceae bacterium]